MDQTFIHVMDIDRWLASVTPDHLPCLTKVVLIISKDYEIIEGCNRAAAWSKCQVGVLSLWFWAGMRGCHVGVAVARVVICPVASL
jgi:hypothetical protein